MKDHMEVLRQIARAQLRRAETAEALVAELEAEREKAVVDAIRWAMREGLVRSALAKALEAVKHSPANWHDIYTELLPLTKSVHEARKG